MSGKARIGMADIRWHGFNGFQALLDSVADAVIALVEEAISQRGKAVLALPGGKTPVAIFEAIARRGLDWTRVTILPTDDRLVASENPLCNSSMLARIFGPVGAKLIPFNGASHDLLAAAALVNDRIAGLDWPLDLVWTGVGEDGHTASILPGPDIEAAFDVPASRRVVGNTPDPLPPEAPFLRVTLTSAALLDTRALMIVMTGVKKRQLVEQAISEAHRSTIPIGRVLADAQVQADIYWCA